eukprot:gene1873-33290_t
MSHRVVDKELPPRYRASAFVLFVSHPVLTSSDKSHFQHLSVTVVISILSVDGLPGFDHSRRFQYPRDDGGKYQHPWMTKMPAGRSKAYNLVQKGVVTLLMGATAYGFYEVGRGCYFIMRQAQERARVYVAAEAAAEEKEAAKK